LLFGAGQEGVAQDQPLPTGRQAEPLECIRDLEPVEGQVLSLRLRSRRVDMGYK
jgi:hypothetical protein